MIFNIVGLQSRKWKIKPEYKYCDNSEILTVFDNYYLLSVFILGLGLYKFSFILLAVYYITTFYNTLIMKHSNTFWFRIFLINTLLLVIFILGYFNKNQPFNFTILLIYLSLSFGIIEQADRDKKKGIIVFITFSLGMFLSTGVTCLYSFQNKTGAFGYGLLFDPLLGMEVNSPSYSNSLIFPFITGILLIKYYRTFLIKVFVSAMYCIIIISAIYLGGRAFFIVAFLSLLFLLNKKQLILVLFVVLFVSIGLLVSQSGRNNLVFLNSVDFIINRFVNWQDTGRGLLFKDGMLKIFISPIGGFTVNNDLIRTKWFHNLWIDVARLGGWFALVDLLLLNLSFMMPVVNKRINHPLGKYFYILSIATLAIMFQDVIIEGNFRVFLMYVLSSTLINIDYDI